MKLRLSKELKKDLARVAKANGVTMEELIRCAVISQLPLARPTPERLQKLRQS